MKKITLVLVFSLLFSSAFAASKRRFQIMSYNVENLFDTEKDEGKNDWTFLPKDFKGKAAECAKIKKRGYRRDCEEIDWTEEALNLKLSQIKKVVDENPYGRPEILGLVEIENGNVVGKLAKKLGYKKFAVTNSPDKRGVDVALLYKESSKKLKFLNFKEYVVPDLSRPTRNILEVNFLVRGKHKLTVFVNHWPSQGGPPEARCSAAKVLKKRIDELLKKDPKHLVVAIGDFNTVEGDVPNPFHNHLLVDGKMKDVRWFLEDDRSVGYDIKNRLAPGSYFYKHGMKWNDLDHIFVSTNLIMGKKREVKVLHDTFNILAPDFATTEYSYDQRYYLNGAKAEKVPFRYNHKTTKRSKAGYSDHFPVTVEFKF